ncbi:MAG: hypothetical protein ACRD5H_18510 [Nitrososphaerales archaeon]
MPYATLAQIKEWLPGLTGAGFDTELTNIQADVNRDIDRKLTLVTSLPITDATIKNELAKYEARISALTFQLRRAGAQERTQIQETIDKQWVSFQELVANRFGFSVVVG